MKRFGSEDVGEPLGGWEPGNYIGVWFETTADNIVGNIIILVDIVVQNTYHDTELS